MTQATYRHGHFVWYELMVSDGAAAEKFYAELLGWTFKHNQMGPNLIYRVIKNSEGRELGGIFQMPDAQGAPSYWCGYVSVPDVDAAAATAQKLGGKLCTPVMDIPHVGRAAYLADPEGAVIVAFRDNNGDAPTKERPGLGDFCWNTLAASNGEKELEFYGAVLGWTRGSFGDAPGLFLAASSGETVADVEPPQGGAPSHWMSHVVVAKLADARAKAESLGARIYAPDIHVPGVGHMAVIGDPWGAVISLYEPEMSG
jgi:uncharacterized protein